jgi:predicted ATPase/transcriptional regulator with XRE-family HTH domain
MLHEVTFGQWLKGRRNSLDFTQQRLADQVGCSVETIYKIEAGKRRPSKQIARLLAEQLGVPDTERGAFVQFARTTANMVFLNPQAATAPWRTPFLPPHNLPARLTSFIGREGDVTAARKKLLRDDVRLLTLIGPPGVGKTRLSIHLGGDVLLNFPDGVFFVELAQVTNPERIASTIAQMVGILETGRRSPLDNLKLALRERQLLLILDNFEHLLEAAPSVTAILAGCPLVKIVVTSRAPLRIQGEWLFPLLPLALPPGDSTHPADQLLGWAAVQLFVERAQTVEPTFALTEANADAVAALCAHLDGLPLAIEIISARVKILPPADLLKSISGQPLLLSEGTRDMEARHQTLDAAIAWSYHLLAEPEQRFFRSMGIFYNGCSLEAAEAVCEQYVSVVDSLTALVHMSLVNRAMTVTDEPRFALLETIREYALHQLDVHAEAEPLRRRHAQYFLDFALAAEPELRRENQVPWLEKLEHDHGNLQAAFLHYRAGQHWEQALQLAGALFEFWVYRSHLLEGLEMMESLLTAIPDDAALRSLRTKVMNGASMLANFAGDHSAAYRYAEEALAAAKQIEDDWNIALASIGVGMIRVWRLEFDRAEMSFTSGLEAARRTHEKWLLATLLTGLGEVARLQADYEPALAFYEQSLALAQEIGHLWIGAHIHTNMGLVAHAQQQFDKAHICYQASLMNSIQLSDERGIAMAVEKLGWVAAVRKKPERAAKLLGAAAALRKRTNAPGDPDELRHRQDFVRLTRSQLDEKAFAAAWQEGEAIPVEQALALALDKHG